MLKTWSDEQIIDYLEKATGDVNGFVARNDDGIPTHYLSKEDNGFVYVLLVEENSNNMDYYKIQ